MNLNDRSLQEPTLSVVIPACNEEGNLRKLHLEIEKVLSKAVDSWEMVFVDDGSKDSTWTEISSLHDVDPRVRGIRLSRNFGHQDALIAGMTYARGTAVVTTLKTWSTSSRPRIPMAAPTLVMRCGTVSAC